MQISLLRRVRWMSVVVGVVVTLLLVLVLEVLVVFPISNHLHGVFAIQEPGGVTSWTMRAWNTYTALSTSLALVALPLAFLLGGLLVGGLARTHPGVNGLVSSLIVVAFGFAWLATTFLPALLDPIDNPGEVYTRSENLQNIFLWATAFCAVSPFALLAGYLGSRLGGRLRMSTRS